MYNEEKYDFRALGKAIKEARESKGLTREKLGELFDLAPRYIMSIENKGQHPSFQVFYELASFFHISVDQFFFPEEAPGKTSRRRRIDSLLAAFEEAAEHRVHFDIALPHDEQVECSESEGQPILENYTQSKFGLHKNSYAGSFMKLVSMITG